MAEGFSVASRLTFTTNASQIVSDLLRNFERLDTVVGATQRNLNRLASELGTLNRGGQGLSRSVQAIERLSQIRLSPELVSGMDRVARSANEAAVAARSIGRGAVPPASPRVAAGAAGGRSLGHHDLLNASMGAGMVGDAGLGFFGGALKAEMEVREQVAMLRMNTTIGDADIEKARATAEKITRLTPGTTVAKNLHSVVEMYTLLGSMSEALEGAPAYAQATYLMSNMPGVHKGDTAFAAAQSVELMQRHIVNGHVNMEAFNKEMAAMTRVAYGTGGRVDGAAYLGFAKQSRVGGVAASDQYLNEDLPAILIAMGGSRAGTGDAAVWNQFVTGKMTKNAYAELKKVGLLDKTAKWHGGQVLNMGRHLRDAGGFGVNRVQWIRDNLLGKDGILARNHIDPNDKVAVARFLSGFASRQTGLGFLSEATLGMDNIDKEALKIRQTTQSPLETLKQNDPTQAIREFQAAQNGLMVSLGKEALGPAIEALKGLTEVVKQLGAVAKEHPELAKDIVLVGGGLSILAKGAGELALVLYVGAPIVLGMRALAVATTLFAVGTPAGLALTALATGIGALAWALKGIDSAEVKDKMLESLRNRTLKPGSPGAWVPPPGTLPPGNQSPLFHKEGWLQPSQQQAPIHLTSILHVDGREVARTVSVHIGREGNRAPLSGTTGADRTISPFAGAMAV